MKDFMDVRLNAKVYDLMIEWTDERLNVAMLNLIDVSLNEQMYDLMIEWMNTWTNNSWNKDE